MLMLPCTGSSWSKEINSMQIKLASWKEVFTSKVNTLSMYSNSGENCRKLNTREC